MAYLELNATCAFGLEAVVARELKALGYDDVRADNGNVRFTADAVAISRANLWLRCADRVWLTMGRFPATTFEQLFEGVKAMPWSQLLPKDAQFPVTGASHASQLSSVPACQGIVKKAVVESLKKAYRIEWFPETGAKFPIHLSLVRDTCTIALDTSGTGLHRRGYRTLTAEAPLRETLAAGLVQLSVWKPERPLFDPFCGSGTIAIEAALIGLKRAPGLTRQFASETWPVVGRKVWERCRQEAEDLFDRTTRLQIYGSDVDADVLRMARHHLRESGMEERGLFFETLDVSDFRSQKKYGVIITNPPYGERLGDQREAERLYRELGRVVQPLGTWSFYVLTSHPDFPRHFGVAPNKTRKLYNGMLQCTYYQYPGPRPPRAVEPAAVAAD